MQNSLFSGERTALVALTQGRVLEVCFETGKNLHYYSPWVTSLSVVCLEGASTPMRHDANDRGLPVELIFPGSDAARLPFADASFDWVVTTLALCRMTYPAAMLAEISRVLKPSGAYAFLEHGRSSDPAMAHRQMRLRKLWLDIGGCDLDLEIERIIGAAGLRIEKLDRYQGQRPKFLSTMYQGMAKRV
ncbi:MAG TPA: class I SAM-dependent methyltransferase [Candidatus Binataceae bacterium]|nr:class I SAM-dependent methyltransferase [Candidatus Binataceae bacterium]